MPSYEGLSPAQVAELDQMGAAFREAVREFRATLADYREQLRQQAEEQLRAVLDEMNP